MLSTRAYRPTPFDICRHFDDLPNSAVVSTAVACVVTGLSDRTVRNHPLLPRVYTSRDRYGFKVGDLRKLLSEGVPPEQIRLRVSPPAQRFLTEVSAASSRSEAEKLVAAFDDSKMGDGERERLHALLTTALAELQQE
jgi:hypothetical protein